MFSFFFDTFRERFSLSNGYVLRQRSCPRTMNASPSRTPVQCVPRAGPRRVMSLRPRYNWEVARYMLRPYSLCDEAGLSHGDIPDDDHLGRADAA